MLDWFDVKLGWGEWGEDSNLGPEWFCAEMVYSYKRNRYGVPGFKTFFAMVLICFGETTIGAKAYLLVYRVRKLAL